MSSSATTASPSSAAAAAAAECTRQWVNVYQQQLILSNIICLFALLPATASAFLAWITHVHDQVQRQQHHQQREPGGNQQHDRAKRRQRRLILAAHVVLLSTSLSFLCAAAFSILRNFYPPTAPITPDMGKILAATLMCNALATLAFQSAGEAVLVHQFMRMYPGTTARRRVLPLAGILVLVRFVSQCCNHALAILFNLTPAAHQPPEWRTWQNYTAWTYFLSVTCIILLLSASFVVKLWSRWHRYSVELELHKADGRGGVPLRMQRVRNVLGASYHHTVLSSLALIAQTAGFVFMSTSPVAKMVNWIGINAYKLVFSLGIAHSIFHLCFDMSSVVQQEQEHQPEGRAPSRWRPAHYVDETPNCSCYRAIAASEAESSTPPRPVESSPHFQHNSWSSDAVTVPDIESPRPTSGSSTTHLPRPLHLPTVRPLHNCTHHACGQRTQSRTVYESWPIVSTNIQTELGSRLAATATLPTASGGPAPSSTLAQPADTPDTHSVAGAQMNLSASARRGPSDVVAEFVAYVSRRFETSARLVSSAEVSTLAAGVKAAAVGMADAHARAILECHSSMKELVSRPGPTDDRQAALFVPIHFGGVKLGVLVCSPWASSASGYCRRTCVADCCVAKRGLAESPAASGACYSTSKDRVHELLRRLSGFFAAYLHSAKQRQVDQETVRQFQHQLALVEATAQAKGTFLANMSHEIRTPAAQVIQAAHILSETQLDPVQQEHVEVILKSSELLLAILNDILDLSKLENGKIRFENRPFALHDAIRHSVDAYAGNRTKPLVDVGYVIDKDVPVTVVGDVVRYRQIWNNLLSNAVKFTETGSIILRAERVAPTVDSSDERVVVRFSVTDTGSGIPEDRLVHIFERFEQSDETVTRLYGGTGLGLSISQSLCLLMDSALRVSSVVGRGSTFSFDVELPSASPNPSPSTHLLRRRSISVLVAANTQPESVRIDTLAHILSGCGLDAQVTRNLDPHTADMQAIVHDRDWPSLGPDIPAIPTIFISSSQSDPPRSAHPHVAYIARPFKQSHLHRLIDSLFASCEIIPHIQPSSCQPALLHLTRHDSTLADMPITRGPSTSTSTFHILVVDDNPLNRKLMVAMLTRLGHTVEQACDGKQAVDRVVDLERQAFAAVLMDVRMPVMDGLEATRRIVQHFSQAHSTRSDSTRRRPVIIGLSADAMTEQEDEGLMNGMDKYLRKPVLRADIADVLERMVAQRRD